MLDRFQEQKFREDRRAGTIVARINNLVDKQGKDWTDYFPEHKAKIKKIKQEAEDALTPEARALKNRIASAKMARAQRRSKKGK